jgi:prepilin-type N-terminal cleavage/methylation domain-containing protein
MYKKCMVRKSRQYQTPLSTCSRRLLRDRTGFTMLELVIAIVIIGMISAIAIPTVNTIVQNSRIQVTENNLAEIKKALIGDPSIQFKGFRQIAGYTPADLNELWNLGASSVANLFPSIDRGQGQREFVTKKVLTDPWDQEIEIGTTTAGREVLVSKGPDGAFDSPKANYDTSAITDDVILILPQE